MGVQNIYIFLHKSIIIDSGKACYKCCLELIISRRSPLMLLPPVVAPESVPEVVPGIAFEAAFEVYVAAIALAIVSASLPVAVLG